MIAEQIGSESRQSSMLWLAEQAGFLAWQALLRVFVFGRLALGMEIIYVLINNEGSPVWRPMLAEQWEEGLYKIKSFPDGSLKNEDEDLQFNVGDVVICRERAFSDGPALVAISKKVKQ